ncbi:MAG: GNAT family N-acetyltransferase [Thalassotalea sp.]|nr:GNAT family N-acetyltransferase [Colwelliaceae bacterium]MCH2057149.1 GNAT family N-acetyltransferase [Thalassotalea sp.]
MTDVVEAPANVEIRASYLVAEDLKLAASLLYQAYHDDPVFLEIFNGDKEDYEQRLRASIREELGVFWQAKQPMVGLYLGEAMVGVACLNSPDEGVGFERFWHWRLKMLLSAGYFSTKQMMEKEKIIMSAVPLKRFHMLSFIAIHPLHQHHGFGHYLMAAVNTVLEEHPDSEGVAVYATNDKYRDFFKDVDYEFIEEVKVGNVSGALMLHYR